MRHVDGQRFGNRRLARNRTGYGIALSQRGDRVAVHYGSNRASAEETLSLLHGQGHHLVNGDLTDPEVARNVLDESLRALGSVDILVNNAAMAPNEANFHRVDQADYATWTRVWRQMIDVDLLAAANMSYLVSNALIDKKMPGTIVNIGSRGAHRGEPDYPAYGAAKAGLHALGQSLAVALAPHQISVVSIAPGFIGTERQESKLSGDDGEALRAQSPFGRVGTPDEVAAAVIYLTSPAAQWASGAVLDLNGASHLR